MPPTLNGCLKNLLDIRPLSDIRREARMFYRWININSHGCVKYSVYVSRMDFYCIFHMLSILRGEFTTFAFIQAFLYAVLFLMEIAIACIRKLSFEIGNGNTFIKIFSQNRLFCTLWLFNKNNVNFANLIAILHDKNSSLTWNIIFFLGNSATIRYCIRYTYNVFPFFFQKRIQLI